MRIIHLVNQCDRGGNVHVAVDLACAQARRGDEVIFISAGGRYENLLERQGVRHDRRNLRSPLQAGSTLFGLARLCQDFKPHILHAHTMSGAIHGFFMSRLFGVPLVTTVHNSFDKHSWLMRLGDRVVAVSNAERALLLARRYKSDKLDVVLNGPIGSPRIDPDETETVVCVRKPCITTLCGLERRKGVHDLIEAFQLVASATPSWNLIIAGDGPERANLEEQARQSGVSERIFFLGHVAEPQKVLSGSDIFVLASYAEPFGLSIAEARQAGCAIIGTRVGGICEQLGDGRYGGVVPPGAPAELAKELRRLMSDSAALARARAAVNLDEYNVARMADNYFKVYQASLH